MRVAVAVLMGLAIISVGLVMLRGMRTAPPSKKLAVSETPPANVRITFWCENCETELLLLRKGSASPPRHCGEPMTEREEVAREG